MKKNGYAYIYFSNESESPVWMDNFQLNHVRGAILEETHYYPFGLTMAGISSSSLPNNTPNRKQFNGIEHTTDLDLNQYDAFYRTMDPQIGRWWQIDPRPFQDVSPYSSMNNNPIALTDFLGDTTNYYNSQTGEFLGTVYGGQGLNDRTVSVDDYNYASNAASKVKDETLADINSVTKDPKTLKALTKIVEGAFTNKLESLLNDSKLSTEISLNSDEGHIASAVYAEMRGGDNNAKAIVAESIVNRSDLPVHKGSENPDGTIVGIINKAYDVSNPRNKAYSSYSNPYGYAGANSQELSAWTNSMSAAFRATHRLSNVGQGVIFYNSSDPNRYDNNKQMQKIQLNITVNGVKGLWKLKQ